MKGEALLLIGVGEAQATALGNLAGNMKIRVVRVDESQYGSLIGEIYDGKIPTVSFEPAQTASARSLLVFANVSDKHFDRLLFEIKSRGITLDYKAVMTDTNRGWNVHRLLLEMEREKSYEKH